MIVKPLDDVMSHFQFAFFAYIVLLIVISLNFCKALYIRKKNLPVNNSMAKLLLKIDLVISVFSGLALASGLMFLGVLADNNALEHMTWAKRLFGISIVSLIIFSLNLVVVLRKEKEYSK